ncbi:hypothetical protein GE061_001237 [Apolygus lucorum]|uniref:Uncharacterized protein n=1 Tax=Apolygus lucorum TaxID=248454 RepID=A0A8S9Y6H5_APOLU|nr:hypothetical protein GE061_001237 [Apolygus lucorum]
MYSTVTPVDTEPVPAGTPADAIPTTTGHLAYMRRMERFLPYFTLTQAGRRANTNAWTTFDQSDWDVFVDINTSVAAQGLSISDFDITTGAGSASQSVGIEEFNHPLEVSQFYSVHCIESSTVTEALTLRLGLDPDTPAYPYTNGQDISNLLDPQIDLVTSLPAKYSTVTPVDTEPVPAGTPADAIPTTTGHLAYMRRMERFLPYFTLTQAGRRANTNAWTTFDQSDWDVFVDINTSVAAQGLSISDFDITTGAGSASQSVGIEEFNHPLEVSQFYSVHCIESSTVTEALTLRLGLDPDTPAYPYTNGQDISNLLDPQIDLVTSLPAMYSTVTPVDTEPVPAGTPADAIPTTTGHLAYMRRMERFLPYFTLTQAGRRANTNAWTTFDQSDWDVFVDINTSVAAQGLSISDFDITTGAGSASQSVRIEEFNHPLEVSQFYSVHCIESSTVTEALTLRLGLDPDTPAYPYANGQDISNLLDPQIDLVTSLPAMYSTVTPVDTEPVPAGTPADAIPTTTGHLAYMRRMERFLPYFTLTQAGRRANTNAWTTFDQSDWDVFVDINTSVAAQGLSISDFDITTGAGSASQSVGIEEFNHPLEVSQFYSVHCIESSTVTEALTLRLGLDPDTPAYPYANKLESALTPSTVIWRPIMGPYPGGCSISLAGTVPYFREFWRRLKSVAQRPLARAMAAQHAEARYLKCFLRSAFVRICCAQDESEQGNNSENDYLTDEDMLENETNWHQIQKRKRIFSNSPNANSGVGRQAGSSKNKNKHQGPSTDKDEYATDEDDLAKETEWILRQFFDFENQADVDLIQSLLAELSDLEDDDDDIGEEDIEIPVATDTQRLRVGGDKAGKDQTERDEPTFDYDQLLSIYLQLMKSLQFHPTKQTQKPLQMAGMADIPPNQQYDLLAFRMRLADQLISSSVQNKNKRGRPSAGEPLVPSKKNKPGSEQRPVEEVVFDHIDHLAHYDDKTLPTRCKKVCDDGFNVLFYKRIEKTQRYAITAEEGFLTPDDIHEAVQASNKHFRPIHKYAYFSRR